MKGKAFWIGGVVVLLLAVTISIGYATQRGVFEGAWYTVDLDGSNEWLWITNYYGAYEVILYDDMCSGCSGIHGEGPSCLGLGSARISEPNTLRMDGGQLYCYWEEGVEILEWFSWEGSETVYDPTTDTLSDSYVVWGRSNDKKEEKIIDPITMPKPTECEPPDLESAISTGLGDFDLSAIEVPIQTYDILGATYELTFTSLTYGNQGFELLDNDDYQLNFWLEDINITYNITCTGVLCYPVTTAWINIDRMDYQGDFILGTTSECIYHLDNYSGDTALTGVEGSTDDLLFNTVLALFIDQVAGSMEEDIRIILDEFFISTIEGAG